MVDQVAVDPVPVVPVVLALVPVQLAKPCRIEPNLLLTVLMTMRTMTRTTTMAMRMATAMRMTMAMRMTSITLVCVRLLDLCPVPPSFLPRLLPSPPQQILVLVVLQYQ